MFEYHIPWNVSKKIYVLSSLPKLSDVDTNPIWRKRRHDVESKQDFGMIRMVRMYSLSNQIENGCYHPIETTMKKVVVSVSRVFLFLFLPTFFLMSFFS